MHPITKGLRAVVPLGAGGLKDSWTSIGHQSMLESGRKQALIPARVSISGVGLITSSGWRWADKTQQLFIWISFHLGHHKKGPPASPFSQPSKEIHPQACREASFLADSRSNQADKQDWTSRWQVPVLWDHALGRHSDHFRKKNDDDNADFCGSNVFLPKPTIKPNHQCYLKMGSMGLE